MDWESNKISDLETNFLTVCFFEPFYMIRYKTSDFLNVDFNFNKRTGFLAFCTGLNI